MPMLCAPTDKPDTVSDMTVVDDNYTGHVEPGTGARRNLPGASMKNTGLEHPFHAL